MIICTFRKRRSQKGLLVKTEIGEEQSMGFVLDICLNGRNASWDGMFAHIYCSSLLFYVLLRSISVMEKRNIYQTISFEPNLLALWVENYSQNISPVENVDGFKSKV